VAAAVATALGDLAIIVPMDGFHLANQELVRLGRADRKGAPDTFDADGFVALVRRLKRLDPDAVVAPVFRRELDATVQGAIRVPASMPLVIVEGNYLLLDQSPWSQLRELLDECWYVEGRADRVESLIARHVSFGKTEGDARAWVLRSDEANARLVSRTRSLADVIVALGA
jgi:pantothenate kinase